MPACLHQNLFTSSNLTRMSLSPCPHDVRTEWKWLGLTAGLGRFRLASCSRSAPTRRDTNDTAAGIWGSSEASERSAASGFCDRACVGRRVVETAMGASSPVSASTSRPSSRVSLPVGVGCPRLVTTRLHVALRWSLSLHATIENAKSQREAGEPPTLPLVPQSRARRALRPVFAGPCELELTVRGRGPPGCNGLPWPLRAATQTSRWPTAVTLHH